MKINFIIALSLLFVAMAGTILAKSEIEEQKVVLPEYVHFHAIEPWDFDMTYAKLYHETFKILLFDDSVFDMERWPVFLYPTKEHFFLKYKTLIKYHERYGAFDNIHEYEKIVDYPFYIQCYAEDIGSYMTDSDVKEMVDGGFELIEKEYGKPLTLKLKNFINHLVELLNKSPEGIMCPPLEKYSSDFYEQLVDYIKSLEEVLITLKPQDEVKSMLQKIYLCTDLEHFATTTLQDVALMYFFWNQETNHNPPPRSAPNIHLQPLPPEASKLAYAPLKEKSVDELVPIIYDALTAKRVYVMYHLPETPYLQALRRKYENMNYRDISQWVYDEIKHFYASSDISEK